jgi:hypothetical protein
MWGGLWLRDPALRAIFPVRRAAHPVAAPAQADDSVCAVVA